MKLNSNKTEFILLETRQQLAKINCISIKRGGCDIQISNQVTITCLGVLVDDEMTFAVHIRRLPDRCFYQLRQLRSVRRALTVEAARTLAHAFIISRVDYCSSAFGSTCAVHLRPLQSVLNYLIVLRLLYETSCTGYRFNRGTTIYSIYSPINAYIGQRRLSSSISVYRSRMTPLGNIFDLSRTATLRARVQNSPNTVTIGSEYQATRSGINSLSTYETHP